jgi:hypothetical protein
VRNWTGGTDCRLGGDGCGLREPRTRAHVATIFAGVDIALTEAEVRRDMGLPKRDHIGRILSMQRVRDAWTALRGSAPGEAVVEELYQEFIPRQFSCLLEYSAVIPGVVEAVKLSPSRPENRHDDRLHATDA